ncbi:MAG: aldehyde dehydrogenase family protein [Halioglobus sp.]
MAQTQDVQNDADVVDELFARARVAQIAFEGAGSQQTYDRAVQGAAWAVMEPARNAELSQLAVDSTGLGNVADKMTKNHRKTLGLLRDLREAKSYGEIGFSQVSGITEIARPMGVIGAVVPSTNPIATPLNNIINALKCGNAIVVAPSPKGIPGCSKLLEYVHAEFDKANLPRDLVQMLPGAASKSKTQRLMELADLVVVTGSQDNVRRAYESGTPAIGVGAGNVCVIVDESANLSDAAQKIAQSKTFDNATSCSSENALIAVDSIYDQLVAELDAAGGRLITGSQAQRLKETMFVNGQIQRDVIAQDLNRVVASAGIEVERPDSARFLVIEGSGIGVDHPESGEKLSLVLTLFRVNDFNAAKNTARDLLNFQGAGHSIGLHSTNDSRALEMGAELPVCRVIVNQAHTFATGGSFSNGLPFSLTMGCGSWGGNSIDDNLNYKHFMNVTKVVRETPINEPTVEEMLGDYWEIAGR